MSFLKFMLNEDMFYPDPFGLRCQGFHVRKQLLPSIAHRRRSPVPSNAPVNRLPYEIIGAIFMHCLSKGEFKWPHIDNAPLLLCRVCRIWRLVAIMTPGLWTSLMIVLPPKTTPGIWMFLMNYIQPQTNLHAFAYGVPTWLSRSGILPLSVRMDVYPTYQLPSHFFDIFLPFFPRFSNLRMHIPSSTLSVLICYPTAWLQLTKFTLSSETSLKNCISILRLCKNLNSCFFQRVFEPSDAQIPDEPFVLPHLQTLKIYGREDLFVILDCIAAPKLWDLDVIFYWPQPWQRSRLIGLFERSECPLQRLAIEGLDIPQWDLLDFARRFEGLLFLEVSLRGVTIVPRDVTDILITRAERLRARR